MHKTVSISPASASSSSCFASIMPCCCIAPPPGWMSAAAVAAAAVGVVLIRVASAARRGRWRRLGRPRHRVLATAPFAQDRRLLGGARPERLARDALLTRGERELLLRREHQAVPSRDGEVHDP